MNFAIDINALRERAAKRTANSGIAASAAKRLMNNVSQLAGLATSHDLQPCGVDRAESLAAVCWTDKHIDSFLARRDRLLRWGWAESDAERLAERLVLRDRETDDRVSCTECRHYRPGHCGNYRRAGLYSSEVGRDLAGRLQRCPGFTQ